MAFKTIMRSICSLGIIAVVLISLLLAYTPTYAYAEEATGEATTEVYLVKTDDGTTPDSGDTDQDGGSTTTITTTTTDDSSSSSTSKTGDTTPVIPFVIAGVVAAAAITTIAIKKLGNIKSNGGENL